MAGDGRNFSYSVLIWSSSGSSSCLVFFARGFRVIKKHEGTFPEKGTFTNDIEFVTGKSIPGI